MYFPPYWWLGSDLAVSRVCRPCHAVVVPRCSQPHCCDSHTRVSRQYTGTSYYTYAQHHRVPGRSKINPCHKISFLNSQSELMLSCCLRTRLWETLFLATECSNLISPPEARAITPPLARDHTDGRKASWLGTPRTLEDLCTNRSRHK